MEQIFKNDKIEYSIYDTETIRPIVKELDNTMAFGYTQQDILDICLKEPFPGSSTYEPSHPVWSGYSGKCKTPLAAWEDEKCLKQAIRNWMYMMVFNEIMQEFNPDNRTREKLDSLYKNYNTRWGKALLERDNNMIAQYVLNRFTVAKIAPRVTALSPTKVLKIMEESGLDFSCGVYCPMGGFNGIPEGAKLWAKKYNKQVEVEAYDINPRFCEYYGYVQRDVTAQHVKTDKIVICCSPYGPEDERWSDTPDINAAGLSTYMGFHQWAKVITEYVQTDAGYVFIGPTKQSKNSCGLFSKRASNDMFYPEYIHGCYDYNIDLELKH
nr:hypothetical protein DGKKSRWO_DGKKSRWO_CDS_0044 [uncultured phage]CAI9752187.1 hypothetical protein CVNMHQAP_CVNMHQAP_CDS_0044 [uncultured phage]